MAMSPYGLLPRDRLVCREEFVGDDGGTYRCAFVFLSRRRAGHDHISSLGVKEGRMVQVSL